MKDKKLSIVIVTYNSEPFISNCLNSIFETSSNLSYELVVIDNNSTDNTNAILKQFKKKINYIRNNDNIGFAKACNLALPLVKGEYILFLNPDTIIKPHSIQILLKFMSNNADTAICAPLLVKPSGELENWQMGYDNLFLNVISQHLTNKLFDRRYLSLKKVDWIAGTAMMIKKSTFEEVGGFDENYFLYYEELDLQRRVKKKGWKIFHVPDSIIIHHGRSRTRNGYKNYLHKSKVYYYTKYYGKLIGLIVDLFR